jgi:hypothetical protein
MAHETHGTWEELRDYVGASGVDNDYVEHCWDESVILVDQYVGDATVDPEALNRAYLECGSELYHRRSAPNGVAQFATLDGGSAIRVARDPMVGAYPILARWMPAGGLGIA